MTRVKLSGSVFVVTAAVLWALDGVLRRILFVLPSLVIVFVEHVLGFILLAPFLFAKRQRLLEVIKKPEVMAWASGIGLLSGLLGTFWFTKALGMVGFVPFSVVLLIQKLQPIFAISAAAVLLKEKVSSTFLGWAGVALAAAFFVTFPNGQVNVTTGMNTVWAAVLALGAAVAWGSSTAFSKKLLALVDDVTVTTGLRFGLTSIFGLVAVLLTGSMGALMAVTMPQILTLLAIAFSTGLVALWVYYKGLSMVPVRVATILELTFPMLAVGIDYFLYGQVLIWTQYLAIVVLVGAMYRVSLTTGKLEEEKV
jgi:drug/metabolite transporter (DMT)-like permease